MDILRLIASAVIAYLLGTIPMGMVIARVYGNMDIRKTGSGNSGTTNVLRTLGWFPSLLTLAGDCVKGALGAVIGRWLGGETGMLLGGLFAILGHDFPFYLRFKGGKGIATSLGVTFVVCPALAPWLVVIVLGIVAITRVMSVGSLAASLAYPVLYWVLMPEGANPVPNMIFAVAAAILSFFCHRSNLARLVKGEENKLDFGKIGVISVKYMKQFRERHKKK